MRYADVDAAKNGKASECTVVLPYVWNANVNVNLNMNAVRGLLIGPIDASVNANVNANAIAIPFAIEQPATLTFLHKSATRKN